MSIRVMSSVWEHSRQKGSKLLLLLAIADFARDDGVAWPSIKSLADMSRMSERQTSRNLRDLIKAGELEVIKQGGSGARDTHKYRVIATPSKGDILSEVARIKDDNLSPITTSKGDTSDALKGDISGHKGDIAVSPDPLIDPLLEPSLIPPNGGSPQAEGDKSIKSAPGSDQPYPMLEAVFSRQGTDPSVLTKSMLGRQLSVAKRLIAEGVTITEVEDCVAWLIHQSWVKSIDMFLIERKLGDFRIGRARASSGSAPVGSSVDVENRRGLSAKEALGKYYQGDD